MFFRIRWLLVRARHMERALQQIRDTHFESMCPYCGERDYPVDSDGQRVRLEARTIARIVEWRIDHAPDCPIAIATAALR